MKIKNLVGLLTAFKNHLTQLIRKKNIFFGVQNYYEICITPIILSKKRIVFYSKHFDLKIVLFEKRTKNQPQKPHLTFCIQEKALSVLFLL